MSTSIEELILLITTDCNLECLYCYARGGENDHNMDWPTALNCLNHAVESLNCRSIQISGGEPLLNPVLLEKIAIFCRLNHLRLKVQTNATLIDANMAERLKSWNAQIGVSLDGLAEINDWTRPGDSSSTQEALRGMHYLKKAGLTVGLTCVISAFNYRHLKDMVPLAIQAGNISGISFDVVRPAGRAISNSELFDMDPGMVFSSINETIQVCQNMRELFGSRLIIREMEKMRYLAKLGRSRRFRCYFDACRQIAVTPQGDLYPCAALLLCPEMNLGNIRDNSIWDRLPELLKDARNRVPTSPKCSVCPDHSSLCGGPCLAQLYTQRKTGKGIEIECSVRQAYLQNLNTAGRKPVPCQDYRD